MRKPVDYDDYLDMKYEAEQDDDYLDVCKECGAVEDMVDGVCQWCGMCQRCGAYGESVTRTAHYCTFPCEYTVNVCDCEEE